MLTGQKVSIYKKYNGDIDSWARNGTRKEKSIISDNDWYVIDGFIQDLVLIKNGLTSEEFNNDMTGKLIQNCQGQEVIEEIKELAEIAKY